MEGERHPVRPRTVRPHSVRPRSVATAVVGGLTLGVLALLGRVPAAPPVAVGGTLVRPGTAAAPPPLVAPMANATLARGATGAGTGTVPGPANAVVLRPVDGDTFVAAVAGRDETVRLLGVDTPETHRPNTAVECFGPEAAAALADALPPGTAVRLERDVEARDRYGRLLAYVHRSSDGLFVNLALARAGLADALAFPPNLAHADEVADAVQAARSRGAGLWGACGGSHEPARR